MVDGISNVTKTQEVCTLINKIKLAENFTGSKCTFVLSKKNSDKYRYFRNISNLSVISGENLNSFNIYLGGLILYDKEAFDVMSGQPKPTSVITGSKGTKKDLAKNVVAKKVIRREKVALNKKKTKKI